LATLQKYIFAEDAFKFHRVAKQVSTITLEALGQRVIVGRLDYPIHDSIYFGSEVWFKELLSGAPDSSARHRTQRAKLGKLTPGC